MRALAMTGIETAALISSILVGSAIRATPPSLRMSAGTRSSAITEQAPASSAIFACSAVVTSMMTPPLSISARPDFTRKVPVSRSTDPSFERVVGPERPAYRVYRRLPRRLGPVGGGSLLREVEGDRRRHQ